MGLILGCKIVKAFRPHLSGKWIEIPKSDDVEKHYLLSSKTDRLLNPLNKNVFQGSYSLQKNEIVP